MKSFLKAFLKILLSVAALYYVYTKIDIRQVIDIFMNVDYLLLIVSLIFFVLSKIVSAWRLNYFFDAINVKLKNRSNLQLYLLGMYYNLFLPGGIGGDGYKVWIMNKKFNTKLKDLFWSVLLDRVNGVFVLFLLALLMVPLLSLSTEIKLYAILLVPISLVVYIIINRKFFRNLFSVIIPTTLLSTLVQVLQLFSALLILFANESIEHPTAYLFLFLISSIVAALPITIGGIGSREITFLFGAKLLHLDINLSIALSLIFYVITLIVSLGGIYFSLNSNALEMQLENGSDVKLNTSL